MITYGKLGRNINMSNNYGYCAKMYLLYISDYRIILLIAPAGTRGPFRRSRTRQDFNSRIFRFFLLLRLKYTGIESIRNVIAPALKQKHTSFICFLFARSICM